MAERKPIAIVKAAGTNPIFDVDHLMRVESYDANLWPSTVVKDVPKLTAHIEQAWATRETGRPGMPARSLAVAVLTALGERDAAVRDTPSTPGKSMPSASPSPSSGSTCW